MMADEVNINCTDQNNNNSLFETQNQLIDGLDMESKLATIEKVSRMQAEELSAMVRAGMPELHEELLAQEKQASKVELLVRLYKEVVEKRRMTERVLRELKAQEDEIKWELDRANHSIDSEKPWPTNQLTTTKTGGEKDTTMKANNNSKKTAQNKQNKGNSNQQQNKPKQIEMTPIGFFELDN